MIPKVLSTRTTRNYNNIPLFNVKHEYFRNSFFPSTVIEWNKLDNNIRNSESVSAFKKQILKFIRPSPNSTFNVHNPHGIKLLTRLRVGLSHLREHKFRHNFQDSLTHSATAVGILKQLFTSFSTAQITQIKEKLFLKKLVTSNLLF